MNRFTSIAIALSFLALSGSSLFADDDKGNNGNHYGNTVTMCHYPHEISVKEKDVPSHLAQGDTMGACPTIILIPG